MHKEIIDSTQCAALLRCTSAQIEELAQVGELPGLQIGGSWLFVRADLLIFLAQKARVEAVERRQLPYAKPPAPPPARVREAPPAAVAMIKQPEQAVQLVTAAEAARLLSMGRSTFWREVAKKRLPQSVKLAGLSRWRVADLQRYVDALGQERITPP